MFESLNFLGPPVIRLVISTTVFLQQQQDSYPYKTEITSVTTSIPSVPITLNLAARCLFKYVLNTCPNCTTVHTCSKLDSGKNTA